MSMSSALKRIYSRDSIIQPLLQKQMVSFHSNLKLVIGEMNTKWKEIEESIVQWFAGDNFSS